VDTTVLFLLYHLGEQNSNYHQVEKLKNEMISRRDDEDVY